MNMSIPGSRSSSGRSPEMNKHILSRLSAFVPDPALTGQARAFENGITVLNVPHLFGQEGAFRA